MVKVGKLSPSVVHMYTLLEIFGRLLPTGVIFYDRMVMFCVELIFKF